MNLITDFFPLHHGCYSTTPLKPGIERRKEMDKSMTNESLTAKTNSYTNGVRQYGWICPVCGRALNPNITFCPCMGTEENPKITYAPRWEVTCKETDIPKTFCSGYMHIEGLG